MSHASFCMHALGTGRQWAKDPYSVKTDLAKAHDRTRWPALGFELVDKGAMCLLVQGFGRGRYYSLQGTCEHHQSRWFLDLKWGPINSG